MTPAKTRRLLGRPDAWIEPIVDGRYRLRAAPDRRARVLGVFDETVFQALVVDPGLRTHAKGGWVQRAPSSNTPPAPPGRPGVIPGSQAIAAEDGVIQQHRANVGQSAIAWLARRRAPDGRAWLEPAEIAAAQRLMDEAELAARGPSVTMRWDAPPRSRSTSPMRIEPSDRRLAAGRRVHEALAACGDAAPIVEAICLRCSALQAAERDLGLARRTGKQRLKRGLRALAAHYRIGV